MNQINDFGKRFGSCEFAYWCLLAFQADFIMGDNITPFNGIIAH